LARGNGTNPKQLRKIQIVDCFGQKADVDKGRCWGKHNFSNHLLAMKGFENIYKNNNSCNSDIKSLYILLVIQYNNFIRI
jgi:hypothetical protein